MKLGIFGGTFDPPHLGHLIVAQDVWSALGLDQVVFLPAAQPPHKRGREITAADIRLRMVLAAVEGDDRFTVSDVELQRAGPSFTVDTLRAVRESRPGDSLYLLIGADQVRELHTWREPGEIVNLATVVGLSRGGERIEPAPGLEVLPLEVTRIDVSATMIRERVAAGQPIRYLVPPGVEQIIRQESLYVNEQR